MAILSFHTNAKVNVKFNIVRIQQLRNGELETFIELTADTKTIQARVLEFIKTRAGALG